MSLQRMLCQQVTILTPAAATDRYGNVAADWSNASSRQVMAWVNQTGSTEDLINRDSTTTVGICYLPPGDPIAATDRIQVNGRTFQVDGQPNTADTPRGVHHIEVRLRDVEG